MSLEKYSTHQAMNKGLNRCAAHKKKHIPMHTKITLLLVLAAVMISANTIKE